MTFHRTEPGSFCRTLRLLSDTGVWELGLEDYSSGTRLRMGPAGKRPSVFDFCLGTDPSLFTPVLAAVLQHLQNLPETADRDTIDTAFPWAGTRPDMRLHLDALLATSPIPL